MILFNVQIKLLKEKKDVWLLYKLINFNLVHIFLHYIALIDKFSHWFLINH